ncbi:flagellar basal body P-ring biosynthesis protein FlgA [Serratia sp. M24T3]|nr:flagellar basal body P-ring biosynthesis protein FlgA [Serratia sp. M24T3]
MIFNELNFYMFHKRKGVFLRNFRLRALMLLGLMLSSTAFSATISARKQVYAEAIQAATAKVNAQAKLQKWQDFSAKFSVFIPGEIAQYSSCHSALVAAIPANDRSSFQRLRYDIRCEDAQGWEVAVTIKPDVYLPVWVAKKNLARGRCVLASDIELKKRNITNMNGGYLTQPEDVLGLTLKRRAQAMQPLSASLLEQPLLVERGQVVTMIAEEQGISAHTLGEAAKKGHKGDIIKVKNLASHKMVMARVTEAGVVRILGSAEEKGEE